METFASQAGHCLENSADEIGECEAKTFETTEETIANLHVNETSAIEATNNVEIYMEDDVNGLCKVFDTNQTCLETD